MRILITGAAGMLGTDARRILAAWGHEVIATDIGPMRRPGKSARWTLRILRLSARCWPKQSQMSFCTGQLIPMWTAANATPIWLIEVNALGTWSVASAAEEIGAALVAVSRRILCLTARKASPYTEFDPPNPISHYGASKRAGEKVGASLLPPLLHVVRTSWLYGVHGKNFPYAMLNLAKTKPEIPVVADQFGTPTYTGRLSGSDCGDYPDAFVRHLPCQQRRRNKLARLRAGHFCPKTNLGSCGREADFVR